MINIDGRRGQPTSTRNVGFLAIALVCALLAGCAQTATAKSGATGTGTVAADSGPSILPARHRDEGAAAGDMMVYEDAQSLTAASDAVVEGTVGKIFAREWDDPTPDDQGFRIRILPVTVRRVLAGDLQPGAVIHVITNDDKINGLPDDFSPLDPGQHVVLFLSYVPDGSPGISSVRSFYIPESGDYGTFDVVGSRATSRAPGFLGLRRGQPLATTHGRLNASLQDLSAAVQAAKP
ncbi:MAG TPA: hypothetical protein VLL08_04515 [Kineosporiaceae bacterium]|nr:hypothetical protein [Kineosporiaceae bacterium]